MGPLTTAAVSRDGSDRWWIVAGLVGLLCRGAASPQATRLETNAIAETEVFIHSSTHANRHPDGKNFTWCLPARSLRSTAPSPACLLDPASCEFSRVDFGLRSTNVNRVNTCRIATYEARAGLHDDLVQLRLLTTETPWSSCDRLAPE